MVTYEYTTPALVQAELRSDTSFGTTTNPSIGTVIGWIEEASAKINQQASRVFGKTSYTEVIDYSGEEILALTNSPIVSVDEFRYNRRELGSSLGTDWVVKVAETDYTFYEDTGEIVILFTSFSPSEGRKRIEIDYTAGYETVPLEVQQLATKMVALRVLDTLISQNVNEGNDGGSISVGSISIVEPASYGVNSYNRLRTDSETMMASVIKGTGLHRYANRY